MVILHVALVFVFKFNYGVHCVSSRLLCYTTMPSMPSTADNAEQLVLLQYTKGQLTSINLSWHLLTPNANEIGMWSLKQFPSLGASDVCAAT